MSKCRHDGLLLSVWAPCGASRGLCLTTYPEGSGGRCVWPLSGCNAEVRACSEPLSVNGGLMFWCVGTCLSHWFIFCSLSCSCEPCFRDNQVLGSRPMDRNHFHSVFFYIYAPPLPMVMMLNDFNVCFTGWTWSTEWVGEPSEWWSKGEQRDEN